MTTSLYSIFTTFVALAVLMPSNAQAFGRSPTTTTDPVDAEINTYKPLDGDSADVAAMKCALLAKKDAKMLVISFEGLASFDSAGARAMYKYHYKLARGQNVQRPAKGGGGYLLHSLVAKMVEEYKGKIEFLNFAHDSIGGGDGSKPEVCARAWLAEGKPLFLTGHSYGGHAVQNLVDALDRKNLTVDYVFSADPRLRLYAGSFGNPGNVRHWENFYQTNTPFLNGYSIPSANRNINLSGTGVGHVGVPSHPQVWDSLLRAVRLD